MLLRYAKLYWQFFKQGVKVWLEYRADFLIGVASVFLIQFTSIYFVKVVFDHIRALHGWTFYEVLFIYGIASTGRSVHHIFFNNLWTLGKHYVQTGNMDRLLIRPINPLFHLIADRVQQDGFGQLLIGLVILGTSMPRLGVQWNLVNLLALALLLVSSGFIYVGINLFFASLSFWMVDNLPLIVAAFNLTQFSQYPLTIYNKGIQFLLTWLIPYGFTAFYPAAYFIDHGVYRWFILWTPLAAVLSCVIAYGLWNRGLRAFASTGS